MNAAPACPVNERAEPPLEAVCPCCRAPTWAPSVRSPCGLVLVAELPLEMLRLHADCDLLRLERALCRVARSLSAVRVFNLVRIDAA